MPRKTHAVAPEPNVLVVASMRPRPDAAENVNPLLYFPPADAELQ